MTCKHSPKNVCLPPSFKRKTICETCGRNLTKDRKEKYAKMLKVRNSYEKIQ